LQIIIAAVVVDFNPLQIIWFDSKQAEIISSIAAVVVDFNLLQIKMVQKRSAEPLALCFVPSACFDNR
jgi:hypothetical protein